MQLYPCSIGPTLVATGALPGLGLQSCFFQVSVCSVPNTKVMLFYNCISLTSLFFLITLVHVPVQLMHCHIFSLYVHSGASWSNQQKLRWQSLSACSIQDSDLLCPCSIFHLFTHWQTCHLLVLVWFINLVLFSLRLVEFIFSWKFYFLL
jgi:hypothetical protein